MQVYHWPVPLQKEWEGMEKKNPQEVHSHKKENKRPN